MEKKKNVRLRVETRWDLWGRIQSYGIMRSEMETRGTLWKIVDPRGSMLILYETRGNLSVRVKTGESLLGRLQSCEVAALSRCAQ